MFPFCFHISMVSLFTQNKIPNFNLANRIILALATFLISPFPTLLGTPVAPVIPASFLFLRHSMHSLHKAFVLVFSVRNVCTQIPEWFSLSFPSGFCSNIIFSVRLSLTTLYKTAHAPQPAFSVPTQHFLSSLSHFYFISRTYHYLKDYIFSHLSVFFSHLSSIDNASSKRAGICIYFVLCCIPSARHMEVIK